MSTKIKMTFTLDSVSLELLDQMRGITPRATYLNFIIQEHFKAEQNKACFNNILANLSKTRPDLIEKWIAQGLENSAELTDDEVKTIAGK